MNTKEIKVLMVELGKYSKTTAFYVRFAPKSRRREGDDSNLRNRKRRG